MARPVDHGDAIVPRQRIDHAIEVAAAVADCMQADDIGALAKLTKCELDAVDLALQVGRLHAEPLTRRRYDDHDAPLVSAMNEAISPESFSG